MSNSNAVKNGKRAAETRENGYAVSEKFSEELQTRIDSLRRIVEENTESSPCVDTFFRLLAEIRDRKFVSAAVGDVRDFADEFRKLSADADRMKTARFKARVLTDEFIRPEQFFKSSRRATNARVALNAALNREFTPNDPNEVRRFSVGERNRLGDLTARSYERSKKESHATLSRFFGPDWQKALNGDEWKSVQEDCRREILLWNYLPAIVKAFIQTKRRRLGLDGNSRRFGKTEAAVESSDK